MHIDLAIRGAGDLVGKPIQLSIHIVSNRIDGGENPRVENISLDENLRRLALVAESGIDEVDRDRHIRGFIQEILDLKITFQSRHANSRRNGDEQS